MLKYAAVAAASKMFSRNKGTKWAYRQAGNVVLNRMRVADGLPERYVDRARWLVQTVETHQILNPGDRVLELGTGWMHWEATVLRLFHDVEVTLYDVVDCRLLGALRNYLAGLAMEVGSFQDIVGAQRVERARQLLDKAVAVESFESFYELMNFTYVVDPDGMLEAVRPGYKLAVSSDVLEHVPAPTLSPYLARLLDDLVPGGYSVHQIDLVDHFHYFDTTMSPKNYYRYDDATWRRRYESDLQYWNRVQRPDWLSLFEGAGFDLIELQDVTGDIGSITLAPRYSQLSKTDLECMQLRVVHQRPGHDH